MRAVYLPVEIPLTFPLSLIESGAILLLVLGLGAVGYWVALIAITARLARREDRKRQGRCSRCGYDLRASPGHCPECGAVRPFPRVERRRAAKTRGERWLAANKESEPAEEVTAGKLWREMGRAVLTNPNRPKVGLLLPLLATLLTLFVTVGLAQALTLRFGATAKVGAEVTELATGRWGKPVLRYRFRASEFPGWYSASNALGGQDGLVKVSWLEWNAAKASGRVDVTYSRWSPSINALAGDVEGKWKLALGVDLLCIAMTAFAWRLRGAESARARQELRQNS